MPDDKLYCGHRRQDGVSVRIVTGSITHPLRPRCDLVNHSPTGFEWGYGGSGPAQLALAILADALGDDAQAIALHQQFKWHKLAYLPRECFWTMRAADVVAWAQAQSNQLESADA